MYQIVDLMANWHGQYHMQHHLLRQTILHCDFGHLVARKKFKIQMLTLVVVQIETRELEDRTWMMQMQKHHLEVTNHHGKTIVVIVIRKACAQHLV